jgi:hypothetical protein
MMPIFTSILGSVASSFIGKAMGGDSSSGSGSSPATTAAAKPTTPNISAGDYTNQQQAYYKNMLSGLGMDTPGGGLPEGIQQSISRQAAML